mgnify:FL=1
MPDTFKAFCPNCETITEQEFIQSEEYILVDNELISVHLRYYVCFECGEDYEIPGADYDPLAELYEKLGLKTYEDRKAFFNVHHIAFNIWQMAKLNNRNSSPTS